MWVGKIYEKLAEKGKVTGAILLVIGIAFIAGEMTARVNVDANDRLEVVTDGVNVHVLTRGNYTVDELRDMYGSNVTFATEQETYTGVDLVCDMFFGLGLISIVAGISFVSIAIKRNRVERVGNH